MKRKRRKTINCLPKAIAIKALTPLNHICIQDNALFDRSLKFMHIGNVKTFFEAIRNVVLQKV